MQIESKVEVNLICFAIWQIIGFHLLGDLPLTIKYGY